MDTLLRNANKFSVVFEMIPIALALLVLYAGCRAQSRAPSSERRVTARLICLSAVLLLVAQSSWWLVYVLRGQLTDTVASNIVWTIFNSFAMVVMFRVVRKENTHG